MRIHFGSILVLVPLGACGTSGAMHQVSFGGACAADDVACARKAPLAPLAIGTRLFPDLVADLAGTSTPNLRLESADPGVLAVEDGALVAKAAGTSAVLISTDDGSVVDFVHVWVAPVTKVTLARRDGDRIAGPIGLAVGEDVTLVPTLWNGPQRLMGDGGAHWTASSGGLVAILPDGSADRRRLRALTPGTTTVTIALATATTTVDLEVIQ
ncbi:MAG: hypothetical protein NT062_02135 [Proteobacteria bacterium]|nr:hypothetical protein [Pseudomonadota bacterium]